MIIGSSKRVSKVMELTKMPPEYKLFLAGLGVVYLVTAWVFENKVAISLAKLFGRMKIVVTGKQKQRKQYKEIQDELRIGAM